MAIAKKKKKIDVRFALFFRVTNVKDIRHAIMPIKHSEILNERIFHVFYIENDVMSFVINDLIKILKILFKPDIF
jgi:hypothetical protein